MRSPLSRARGVSQTLDTELRGYDATAPVEGETGEPVVLAVAAFPEDNAFGRAYFLLVYMCCEF